MISPRHLMKMSLWARRPPSEKQIKFLLSIIAIVFVIWGVDWMGWWPEWAKTSPIPRGY